MNIPLSNRIKWYSSTGKMKLSFRREDNIFTMNGYDYLLRYLDEHKGNRGGNSNVFMLCDPADPDNDAEHYVIKICKKPIEESSKIYKKRFKREIYALGKVRSNSKNNFIVESFQSGNIIMENKRFPFYIMEYCNSDLTKYIEESELDITEKVTLCYYIIQGFCDLHGLGIYHRDIKSDNFLMKENICKIGDLGLTEYRPMDVSLSIDETGDRIGAFGWESPEVMNKILTEENGLSFDCNIDTASDIFQLGKLFWYIFQGNLPIGQVEQEDFLIDDLELFKLIYKMLEYKKGENRRPVNIRNLKETFKPIAKKYSVI